MGFGLGLSLGAGAFSVASSSDAPADDPEEDPIVTWIASGSISAHRVVKMIDSALVGYCDANALDDRPRVLGVSLTAASDGQPIDVQKFDRITEPSWSWTPGLPIYCGPLGMLTQAYDAAWAWVEIVGVAIDRTSMWVRLQSAVVQT